MFLKLERNLNTYPAAGAVKACEGKMSSAAAAGGKVLETVPLAPCQ